MKYRTVVTTVRDIEIEFHPNILEGKTEKEYLEEFRASFFPVFKWDDIVSFVVEQIAAYDEHFCEGIGRVESDNGQDWPEDPIKLAVKFRSEVSDMDTIIR